MIWLKNQNRWESEIDFCFNQCQKAHREPMRKRESNKSPLVWGPSIWLDDPKRLIKIIFLMLIFVFSQKGWHILEKQTACIFNGRSLHIFSSAPNFLVLCHRRLLLHWQLQNFGPFIRIYLLLVLILCDASSTFMDYNWNMEVQIKKKCLYSNNRRWIFCNFVSLSNWRQYQNFQPALWRMTGIHG